jgi:hypothetical protein
MAGGEVSPVGLSLPDGMRVNDWERLGDHLGQWRNTNLWWIADWAAYGDRCYRKEYPALLMKLYDRESLQNLARVASAVESTRRRDDLSFTHHAEVAALDPVEQSEWLADAFDESWSTRELRERIQAWRGRDRQLPPPRLTVRAPGEIADLVARAAAHAGAESAAEWALAVLEREARQELALEAA